MDKPFYGSVQVCFDCKNRQIGCHADCEVYKQAKMELEKHKETIRESRNKYRIGYSNNKARMREVTLRTCRNYGV